MPKRVALLGSTGSIGSNTLKIASSLKDQLEIVALSADSNIKLLAQQAAIFRPKFVCVRDEKFASEIKPALPAGIKVLCGNEGLEQIVSDNKVDVAVFAISGSSCIRPLIKAIKSKKKIALANKEALVSAGSIIMGLAREKKVEIIPIDSEHSAIFQCIEGRRAHLNKIYLTATGGPLLNIPKRRFDNLSVSFILNHPKWNMGRKISVDSATMMNKGLEIIEAKWLFDIDQSNIEVLVHPEAIVHSMVELIDGTVLAQMSMPDMRLPIQYAITYPDRFETKVEKLDLTVIKELSFKKPDVNKFPCVELARHALKKGGAYPAVLNSANEEAVKSFLTGGIKFSSIPYIIEKVLGRYKGIGSKNISLNSILEAECWAREEALRLCH